MTQLIITLYDTLYRKLITGHCEIHKNFQIFQNIRVGIF